MRIHEDSEHRRTPSGARTVVIQRFPNGSRFKAAPQEIRFRGDWATDFAWRGRLEGHGAHGHAVITMHGGYISGRISFSDRDTIWLKPGPEPGVVRLLELDSSLFPGCGTEHHEGEDNSIASQPASFPPVAPASAGSAPIIDVMVLYTPAAKTGAGGESQIETTIQNMIDVTNVAYANSQVHQRLNLVHTQQANYLGDSLGEGPDQQLSWLGTPQNPNPTVNALRDQHQADLVALISEDIQGFCGVARFMSFPGPAFEAWAFSVTQRQCAIADLAFAHELGHNMALHHDPDNAVPPDQNSYPWSYGHFFQLPSGNRRRTIMSYPCATNCPDIEHFSNPSVFYRESETDMGVATGITDQRDNARTLNLTANIVANFRQGNWLYSDRFEERGYALSGTIAPPPMTEAEICQELETQLSQFEALLAEKAKALDEADEDAVREFRDETQVIEDIRSYLAHYCA